MKRSDRWLSHPILVLSLRKSCHQKHQAWWHPRSDIAFLKLLSGPYHALRSPAGWYQPARHGERRYTRDILNAERYAEKFERVVDTDCKKEPDLDGAFAWFNDLRIYSKLGNDAESGQQWVRDTSRFCRRCDDLVTLRKE